MSVRRRAIQTRLAREAKRAAMHAAFDRSLGRARDDITRRIRIKAVTGIDPGPSNEFTDLQPT